MKKLCLLLIFISVVLRAASASDNTLAGARATGMANAAVVLDDVWSVSYNQAGLALLDHPVAGIYFDNRFMVSELAVKSFAFALPVKNSGTFAIHATQFGYSQYKESKAGIAYGRKLGGKVSAGIQLDYLSTVIADDYGSRNSFVVEGGILAEPIANLRLGVQVFNPTRAKLAEYDDERIPAIFRVGAGYTFSGKVLLTAEVEKDIDFGANFRAGIEYHPIDVLFLRGGIATDPSLSCFGFGLKLKNFMLDASASYHATLGFAPQVGLTYDFRKP
jgi:hypothetical protein